MRSASARRGRRREDARNPCEIRAGTAQAVSSELEVRLHNSGSSTRRYAMLRKYSLALSLFLIVIVPVLLLGAGSALAACTGPGAPTTTQTKCLTAIQIPGNPLRSFDISWVNPDRAEYYLAERSNAAIVVIDTRHLTFKRLIGGFVGIKNNANGTVNNNISGPDGVVTRGRWLYAGDG